MNKQNFNVTIFDDENNTYEGMFSTSDNGSVLILVDHLDIGFRFEYTKNNVKYPGNFIASNLVRLDTKTIFTKVVVNNIETTVEYPLPLFEKYLVSDAIPLQYFPIDQKFYINDEFEVDPKLIGFKEIEAPRDFEFTKNPIVNTALLLIQADINVKSNVIRILNDWSPMLEQIFYNSPPQESKKSIEKLLKSKTSRTGPSFIDRYM